MTGVLSFPARQGQRKGMRSLLLLVLSTAALSQAVPPPPTGQVIVSNDHPPAPAEPQASSSRPSPAIPDALPATPVTNEERSAIQITAYDLDVHLTPAESTLECRVSLRIRNAGAAAVSRIPLQLSSTLRWQTLSLPFTQSPISTDTDHTGYAEEAVLILPHPLAAGASTTVTGFYAGQIEQTAARLEIVGTPQDKADQSEWDQIAPTTDAGATALRGFGNVIWYPVAAPTAALGDGNRLFELINRQRALATHATLRLRLAVGYLGDPPAGAILDGELQPLAALPDTTDDPVAVTHGVALAEFAERTIGLRAPSLFLTAQQPSTTPDQLLSVITPNAEAIGPYAEAAAKVRELLATWFGPTPLEPMLLLDHPGEPFEDHAFLAGQLVAQARPADIAPALVGTLTHAFLRSAHPWIDEGLPRFMALAWTERTQGREAAVKRLEENNSVLAFAEPDLSAPNPPPGEALTEATSDVYYRRKAAAVWWQLREILTQETLEQALVAYRHSESLSPTFDVDPKALQHTLERVSKRDLSWFFDDWVYRDRGLPDLTILNVSPRPLPARAGKSAGFLVAVEIRNDGEAVAEVPVTVRSATLTASERLRIPAHGTLSARILFEDTPESVQVNDNTVPELRTSIHTRQIESKL